MTQKQREPHRQDLVEAQRSGCNHLLPGPPDQSLMILPVGNREIAQQKGWFLPVPLPEDRAPAQTFESQKPNPTHQSLVETHAKLVERWWQDGIRGTTIHQGLVNRFGFTGAYSSVRRYLKKLHRDQPQATGILEFEPGEVQSFRSSSS